MTSSTKTRKNFNPMLFGAALIIVLYLVIRFIVYGIKSEENNFSVSNATVVSFSYNTTTTTFTYNLALFVTVPETFESINYFKATASYLNHRFASEPDETLVHGFTGLSMRFNGEYVVPFSKDQLLTLNNNHMAGLYNITIIIWPAKTHPFLVKLGFIKALVLCDIQVPLQSRVFCGWTDHD
ncbi:uncharacterized protein LOC128193965 [Vigna angularis]|uniref:uncharacterized protein LOC128193965 n=1 Tax=Phaseolus angularis TaxID=3914 RepID=UPI0022B3492E|nr:uncharacterized protein LOC128193965 [Vigna angularis]